MSAQNKYELDHEAAPAKAPRTAACSGKTPMLVAFLVIFFLLFLAFLGCFIVFRDKYYYELMNSKGKPDWQNGFVSDQVLLTFLYNGIASDATACSLIGTYVLNTLNGSAMDAAVSTVLCAGIANMHSTGVGGGSFLMYYQKSTKTVSAFNYREVAPYNATEGMYNGLPPNASTAGGLAIGVPGEVRGLALAHSKFGRLPWKTVVTPVVQLLRNGQRVTQALADAMASTYPKIPIYPPYDEMKSWMQNPATGKVYVAGDILIDEKLAATMEKIGEDPESYYNGSLAQDILRELGAASSIITAEDLRDYQPREAMPVMVTLRNRGLRVHALPPPSSGAVLAFILNILDGYAMDKSVMSDLGSYVNFLHRLIEAYKFGFAKRSALGDPAFINVSGIVANLTSGAYADEVRAQITDGATHGVNYYGPSFEWRPDAGTSHVALVDSEGNAVTVTSTINGYFGSYVKGNKTGIIYNNEMDDFSVPNRTNLYNLAPSPSNFIRPGKRPLSSMSPVFVTDAENNLKMISGAAGGSMIITSVASTLARQIYLGQTVKEATDAFRMHHQLVPDLIQYNKAYSTIPKEIMDGLTKKGHKFATTTSKTVVEALVRLDNGKWQAAGDFRKSSLPSGN